MSSSKSYVSARLQGAGLLLLALTALAGMNCGGTAADEAKGGAGGDNEGGGGGETAAGTGGTTAMMDTGGTSVATGGTGGVNAGGGAAGSQLGGTGGGGTGGVVGQGGMGGQPGIGGAMAAPSDKTKEKLWFDGNVTLGGSIAANVSTPSNWVAPINYYDGQILVRLDVTKGTQQLSRVEICMWKSGPSDSKHTCPTLLANILGEGEFTKQNINAGRLLLNVLSQATMTKSDFETPFAISKFNLVKEHGSILPGPITGHLTMVLVPKGLEFSGWAGYPK